MRFKLVVEYDGTDRHLAVGARVARLVERAPHRVVVGERRGPHGGGGGIRTHGGLHLTRFPSVPIRPLSHPSKDDADAYQFRVEAIGEGRHTSWR